jgi:hypothetical protein
VASVKAAISAGCPAPTRTAPPWPRRKAPVITRHASQSCSQDGLRATGGAGLFYCFGVD